MNARVGEVDNCETQSHRRLKVGPHWPKKAPIAEWTSAPRLPCTETEGVKARWDLDSVTVKF
jgi:hypothetical protein